MALDVPTTLDTVRPAVPLAPAPRVPMHSTDDAVIHLDVPQSASPSTAVVVASVGPNDMPVSVTLATADGTLYGDAAVTTGPVDDDRARLRVPWYAKDLLNISISISRRNG